MTAGAVPARALVAHVLPERAPLVAEVGDEVEVGETDTTWPAFVFVTAAQGTGWVPERHLGAERPRTVVRHRYDTQELATVADEQLDVDEVDAESGWAWCRRVSGEAGWVPLSTLEVGEPGALT